ncbi:MAG: hypothetical protein EXR85_10665 [Xanthomonadales bacterium]|nr:hypothetical protein [Xanthomonadales bacterium]
MRRRNDQFNEAEAELDVSVVQAIYSGLSTAEPPALLDQAVLNLARRESERTHERRINTRHWIAALSTTCVLALSLGLLMHRGESPPGSSGAESSKTKRLQPAAAEQEHDELRAMHDQAAPLPEQSTVGAAAPMEAQPAAPAEPAAAGIMKSKLAKSVDSTGDPDAWLQRILQLQQAGDAAQLATELQAFRAAYPDYPLPQALQD